MKKILLIFSLLLLLPLVIIGCSVKNSALNFEQTSTNTDDNFSYPVDGSTKDISYPIEEQIVTFENRGPDFSITEPVLGSSITIEGTGPAGVPIRLVDVSEAGKILGEVIIEQNGTFIFNLDQPIESGHSIGIQLGNISNTNLNESDFLYNENYYDRPLIGILFDMVVVE
jgi:hypothetical protein